jgi:hypothetical protein
MKLFAHISLIILILLQSVGVTYSRHYCMEVPADWKISVTGEKADCGMHQPKPAAHCESEPVVPPADCCDTQVEYLQLDDEINQPVQQKASFDFVPVLLFIVTFALFNALQKVVSSTFPKGHLPPLLFRKRLLQRLSFLQIFRN